MPSSTLVTSSSSFISSVQAGEESDHFPATINTRQRKASTFPFLVSPRIADAQQPLAVKFTATNKGRLHGREPTQLSEWHKHVHRQGRHFAFLPLVALLLLQPADRDFGPRQDGSTVCIESQITLQWPQTDHHLRKQDRNQLERLSKSSERNYSRRFPF